MGKSELRAVTEYQTQFFIIKKRIPGMTYGFCLRTYIEPGIGWVGQ